MISEDDRLVDRRNLTQVCSGTFQSTWILHKHQESIHNTSILQHQESDPKSKAQSTDSPQPDKILTRHLRHSCGRRNPPMRDHTSCSKKPKPAASLVLPSSRHLSHAQAIGQETKNSINQSARKVGSRTVRSQERLWCTSRRRKPLKDPTFDIKNALIPIEQQPIQF